MQKYLFPASSGWCYVLAAALAAGSLIVWYFALAHDRSRGRRRCPSCWYDMSAATDLRCPECGHSAKNGRALLKTRRRWRLGALGLLLTLYAAVTAWIPDYRDWGWGHRLPTWMLVWLYPWADTPNGVKQIRSDMRPVFSELLNRVYVGASDGQKRALAQTCLDELATQTDWIRRRDAYILLGACGKGNVPPDAFIATVRAEVDPNIDGHAWNALAGALSEHPAARDLIIARIHEHPDDTVAGLIKRLPDKGPAARDYVPALAYVARNGTQAGPGEAAWKLMLMGPLAEEALPTLDELVKATPPSVYRPSFIGAAGCIRGEFKSDAEVFAAWLHDPDPQVRVAGAHMLSSFEVFERAHAVTDQIIEALEHPRADDAPMMEDRLIEAVRLRGRRALRAIPRLEQLAACPGLDPRIAEHIREDIDYIRNAD